jgi:hypothetical protein
MNPVSTRGRSMARDRRTFRALLVTIAIVGSSLATGCLRSPMLRPADGPVPQRAESKDPSPVNQTAASLASMPQVVVDSGDKVNASPSIPLTPIPAASAATAPLELQAAPATLQAVDADPPAASPQPKTAIPPATPPAGVAPGGHATPLLDAAIERVAAIRKDQRDLLDPAPSSDDPDKGVRTRVAPAPPAAAPTRAPVKKPGPVSPADPVESGSPAAATITGEDDLLPKTIRASTPKEDLPLMLAEPPSKPDAVSGPGSADPPREKPLTPAPAPAVNSDIPSAVPPTADLETLGIGKLRLCRKVHGFGSVEPLLESEVKAGQRMLVYCEMTGMSYEAKDASFVSRLSSKIEIIAAGSGAVVWTRELGPAEDVCGSRRHDFYVNYRVDLPKTLPPGSYHLRLTQTDLVANRTTSGELPFDIVP